jgi:hypothetical protein
MMGVLLIGRIDHRAYPDKTQAEGLNDCGCAATKCGLDYCLRWNNASQKVIITATISTYRVAMGATECD